MPERPGVSRRKFIGSVAAGSCFLFLPGIGRVRAGPYDAGGPADYTGRLCYNENPLGPSPQAVTAMEAAARMAHRYPDWENASLEADIASRHGVSPSGIVVGAGATEVIRLVADAFLGPGDEMITAAPTYFQMAGEALANGSTVVHVPVDGNHDIDLAQVSAAVTPSTRMISLVNPNNPLGRIIDRTVMEAFVGSLPAGTVLVVDEAYHDYVSNSAYESCVRFVKEGRAVVVIRTFSKVFGLAGARVGYSVSSAARAAQIASSQLYGTVSRNGQSAAAAALTDPLHVAETLSLNAQAMDVLRSGLTNLGLNYIHSETNFLMFDTGGNAVAVADRLAASGYQVRTGWGMPQHIRVSTGTLGEMNGFLDALAEITDMDAAGDGGVPGSFGINSVHPNPFNAGCTVRFTGAGTETVLLAVYDMGGRKVTTLINGRRPPGAQEVFWDGTDIHRRRVPSGSYLLLLRQGEFATGRKIMILN